ncbi:MAG: PilZ domain-containing protein [Candidatus Omnitrophota bacterium]|nr:PilZ domain-containing protein [Candidatus Omnitrophota bacterium]
MGIRIREVNSINILDIDGKVDINSSDIIEMVGWLVNTGKVNLILNFENSDTVDYNGLSILAIAYKNIINHKGKMKLLNVPLAVIELFKVVKLDSIFETYTDEESAINSFYDEGISKMQLRRRFQRLDIHISVKYKMMGDKKKTKIFDGRVLNISAAGVYIYSPYTFPINSLLDLEFSLPSAPAVLAANGKVSWMADKELQSHYYPGMGVTFIHLTPEKEQAIIEFIDKNVTHRAEPL